MKTKVLNNNKHNHSFKMTNDKILKIILNGKKIGKIENINKIIEILDKHTVISKVVVLNKKIKQQLEHFKDKIKIEYKNNSDTHRYVAKDAKLYMDFDWEKSNIGTDRPLNIKILNKNQIELAFLHDIKNTVIRYFEDYFKNVQKKEIEIPKYSFSKETICTKENKKEFRKFTESLFQQMREEKREEHYREIQNIFMPLFLELMKTLDLQYVRLEFFRYNTSPMHLIYIHNKKHFDNDYQSKFFKEERIFEVTPHISVIKSDGTKRTITYEKETYKEPITNVVLDCEKNIIIKIVY